MKRLFLALPLLAALSACEQLGIEDPVKTAAAKEAEGKAIGSACRHAMRAIEDCYVLNPKAQKAAVYAGWRAAHYFDYTRLKATRRQLARLGIGELSELMPSADAAESARTAAREERERSENEGPRKDRRGVDITPP